MRRAEGTVVELDAGRRYRVQVNLGTDPSTGKRLRSSRTVRGSRKDAESALREMLLQNGSRAACGGDMTLDWYWEHTYMPYCESRLRPSTVNGYRKDYGCLLADRLGHMELRSITPLAVDAWLDSLKPSRRPPAYKLLRQMMSRAVKWRLIDRNPCDSVDAPKSAHYEPRPLSADEASAYVRHFLESGNLDAVKILMLALGGGFRRSEIAALNWLDVSADGAVSITKAVTEVRGGAHEDAPKSRFGERVVHLPAFAVGVLNGLRPADDGGAVLTYRGRRMRPQMVSRVYERVRDSMPPDVRRISLKDMRHTSLTLTLEGGADLLAVSRRAGHSTTAITASYYLRPHESVDRKAAGGLDALMPKLARVGTVSSPADVLTAMLLLVGAVGLEPTSLAAADFKSILLVSHQALCCLLGC